MDNKSFSLQFNPMTNVKCVKDYEDEITRLKSENFELKAQLTHSGIPKVLYENKQEMENLHNQKQELQSMYENLNRAYQTIQQEKKVLENKYSQDLTAALEKSVFVEDENKRLVLRLEKLNKEVHEIVAIKGEFNNFQERIQNQERSSEQQKYFYEKELSDMKDQFEKYKNEMENQLNSKMFEIEGLKKQSIQNERNNSFIISDLKATVNSHMRDKGQLEESLNKNKIQEKKIAELEMKVVERDEDQEKIRKEQKAFYNGMEKFKSIISKRMNEITGQLQGTSERFLKIKAFCYISDENYRLLNKLSLNYSNFNEIISFFKDKHLENHKKIEILKKEVSDATFFASNTKNVLEKKTIGFIQEIREQFNEAKNELMVCRKYLEKKAMENKILKNENGRLMNEAINRGRQLKT